MSGSWILTNNLKWMRKPGPAPFGSESAADTLFLVHVSIRLISASCCCWSPALGIVSPATMGLLLCLLRETNNPKPR